MKNFEIGEKVKCIDRSANQFIKIGKIYTVLGYRASGEVILAELPTCAYEQTFFEPIKAKKLKIPTNKIKITVDDLSAPNTINCAEFYEKWVLGKFNKKEGNKMIESINLIDLYANKHRESIEKETKEKIEKIKNESSIKKQYDEITQKCKDDLQKLYISQFTDEEIEKVKETLEGLSDYQKELQHKTSICEFGYFINSDFKNDEIKNLENEMVNKINELNDLVKTVKAHVGIAKTKEEVEEILTRYGIIDKKGKLVIK